MGSIFRYDTDLENILKKIILRASSDISEYRTKIHSNEDFEQTNDIPFRKVYQDLLKANNYQNLISLLLHVDGINLSNSSKLKLWMLTGSVIELPPKLRSRRFNMVVLSIWIGYTIPPVKIWLASSMNRLQSLKRKGKIRAYHTYKI